MATDFVSAQTFSEELLKKAQGGDAAAMDDLGRCYHSGLGVAKNDREAVRWWTEACREGVVSAYNSLGNCYAQGLGVAKSPAQAVELYMKGARLGDRAAIVNLVACYREGRGVSKDPSKANMLDAAAHLVEAGDMSRALNFVNRALPVVRQDKSYESFAREYVAQAMSDWSAENAEATDSLRSVKSSELNLKAERVYVDLVKDDIRLNLTLKEYNEKRKAFLVLDPQFGEIFVQVPEEDADQFARYWLQHEVEEPTFGIEQGHLALKSLIIKMPYGKRYGYGVDLKGDTANGNKTSTPVIVSDVDVDIPVNPTDNDKTFVVVFANERYRRDADSECSLRDGEIFARYCHETLGIPDKNIRFAPNATLNDIRYELRWLKNAVNEYGGNAEIIVYYSGHGMADPRTREAYILPSDGFCEDLKTGYKLDDLCDELSLYRSRSTLLILDSSFAGVRRDGATLETNRNGRLMPRQCVPSGKMMVFTAAENDETAYVYREKGHGAFTYFLLKKLQQTRGEVTLGDLSKYVAREVRDQAWVGWRSHQTPRALVAITLSHVWRPIRLR